MVDQWQKYVEQWSQQLGEASRHKNIFADIGENTKLQLNMNVWNKIQELIYEITATEDGKYQTHHCGSSRHNKSGAMEGK